MRKRAVFFSGAFLCVTLAATASPIIYQVTVNTSSISGTAGSIDFNFNPGSLGVSQSASAQVLNFASDGSLLGVPMLIGDVSGGPLPLDLTFDNQTVFNDYFQGLPSGGFKFGSTLSFDVSLYGPALSSPDGTSTSGSTFAFSMFSNPAGTVPALTNNLTDGFAFKVDVNPDGTTTVTNFSDQTTVVPEPSSFVLIGTALGCCMVLRLWRQQFCAEAGLARSNPAP